MDFKFAWLVELLQSLDNARLEKVLPSSRASNPDHKIVRTWFANHGSKIQRQGKSAHALLACMFPERLPQRSYAIKEGRLSAIFGRALGPGATRAMRLKSWREGSRDFASCVEAVMAECESDPPSPTRQVTLQEIDIALGQLAANRAFSAPKLRRLANDKSPDELLAPIIRRLKSSEAKWLVRMILKTYSPVQIPEQTAMLQFHFLLPSILAVQDSIEAAIDFLSMPNITQIPPNPDSKSVDALRKRVAGSLVPCVGVMIRRPRYEKARSIKHCLDMAHNRTMSVERKYDGEYCQIHIYRSAGRDPIQIFSKSGKDSSEDRVPLHGAIKESLSLDRPGCKIEHKCILEGELLIYNRAAESIEPFHKIRRHVMHGRRFIGNETDSPTASDEQLMIVYYDALYLDERVLAVEKHSIRRKVLKGLVRIIPGMATITERKIVDFRSKDAVGQLREEFARSITLGWEGFVLKGSNDPFFSLYTHPRTIKLKKDYICGLGETVDLCVIGGRYEPRLAEDFGLRGLSWTTFYLACLENKQEVVRFGGKPRFKVIDTVDRHGISPADIEALNKHGQFVRVPTAVDMPDIAIEMAIPGFPSPTEVFRRPFAVEVMGAGFDKNSNCNFFTIRFPRLTKIHLDRDLHETMSFSQLQVLAEARMRSVEDADFQADAKWIERLVQADGKPRYIYDKSRSTSPAKTPLRSRAFGLSPMSSRKSKTPVLVRIDTDELPQHDTDTRLLSSGRTASLTSSPLSLNARLKRRASERETKPTPTESTTRKRRRTPPETPCGGSLQHQRGNTTTPLQQSDPGQTFTRSIETGEGIWSGSPIAHNDMDASKYMRQPLAEMTNVSPRLDRLRPPSAETVWGLRVSSAEALRRKVNEAGSSPTNGASIEAATITNTLFLPTSVTCSSKSVEIGTHQEYPTSTEKHAHHSTPPPSSAISAIRLKTPLLLGRSVRTQDGGCLSGTAELWQADVSFTYSPTYFVRCICESPHRIHVVVVDGLKLGDIAKDIHEVGRILVESGRIRRVEEDMIIIFAEPALMTKTMAEAGKPITLTALMNTFCAGLEFGPKISDDKGQRAARAVWKWTEIEGEPWA